MGESNQRCLTAISNYLEKEHNDKKGSVLDLSQWKAECVEDSPRQENGSDCGVFVCVTAQVKYITG